MDAMTEKDSLAAALAEPRARIGLIIPSVNRMTEPQFNHYAPEGLGIHVARGRVAGQPGKTVAELTDEIAHAAGTLADAGPDLIVFHCTHTSMKEGADGEARIINLIQKTTGIEALSTSSLVNDALRALGLKKLVVLSPYHVQCADHQLSERRRLHRGEGRGAQMHHRRRLRGGDAAALARARRARTTRRKPTASS